MPRPTISLHLALLALFIALLSHASASKHHGHHRRSACANKQSDQPLGYSASPPSDATDLTAASAKTGLDSSTTGGVDSLTSLTSAGLQEKAVSNGGPDFNAAATSSTALADPSTTDALGAASTVPVAGSSNNGASASASTPSVSGATSQTAASAATSSGAGTSTQAWMGTGPGGNPVDYPSSSPIPVAEKDGLMSVGYITEWGIYNTTYDFYNHYTNTNDTPNSILGSTNMLTHAIFAFGCPDDTTGEVIMADLKYDESEMATGTLWQDLKGAREATTFKGSMGQLWQQKQVNRNLKVMLSIGGYNCSQDLSPAVPTTHTGFRDAIKDPDGPIGQKFVESTVELVQRWGLDGIDLDWEPDGLSNDTYPDPGPLAKKLRDGLKKVNDKTLLSCTLGVAAPRAFAWRLETNAELFDFYNLMGFDFFGPNWAKETSFQNNWAEVASSQGISVTSGIANLKSASSKITNNQINVGMPLYGQGWSHLEGATAQDAWNAKPCGPACNYTNNSPPYKILPASKDATDTAQYDISAADYNVDKEGGAAWWYGSSPILGDDVFVSYESPDSANIKIDAIHKEGLGGMMYWDLHADKDGEDSLVYQSAAYAAKVAGGLAKQDNNLCFPDSPNPDVKALADEHCK